MKRPLRNDAVHLSVRSSVCLFVRLSLVKYVKSFATISPHSPSGEWGLIVSYCYYRQACAAGIAITQWCKSGFFAPHERHIALINVTFGTLTRAKFHVYGGKNVGIRPPRLLKFSILSINLPLGVFFYLSRFRMTKFVIAETLLNSVSFKTITVSLHRGRLLLVHVYSSFSIDPQDFPLGKNLCQKFNYHFWRI